MPCSQSFRKPIKSDQAKIGSMNTSPYMDAPSEMTASDKKNLATFKSGNLVEFLFFPLSFSRTRPQSIAIKPTHMVNPIRMGMMVEVS